jgi:tRNA(Ile)-lysidine synthase
MLAQLLEARPDAQLLVTHPECHVRRHRDRLYLTPKLADLAGMRERDDANIPGLEKAGQDFNWHGEASLAFPAYGGVLHFDPLEEGGQGIDIGWLKSQLLTIDFRQGGERLKLALNRPTKSLKYHYQAFDVPAWERERLPLVCAAQQLLYAAGIGLDCHCLGSEDAPRVTLRWAAA